MKKSLSGFALLAAFTLPAVAGAQDKSALLLRVPSSPSAIGVSTGRAQPGVTTASPIGFGPNFRDVFVAFSYQESTRFGGGDDGTASIGFGLGNSATAIGVEAVLTSLSTVRGGFGERTVVSFKVHRQLPGNAAIGVGVEGIELNGDAPETKESVYAAITKVVQVGSSAYFNALTLNVGAGNGRFQSEEDFIADKDNVNVFASAGLRISQKVGAIADWTGQDLSVGLSIAPFSRINLVVTPAIADITENAGNGARFIIGAGLSRRF